MSTSAGILIDGVWYFTSSDGYPDEIVPVLEEIIKEFKEVRMPDQEGRQKYLGFILQGLILEERLALVGSDKEVETDYDYELDGNFNVRIYENEISGRKEINYREYMRDVSI